MIEKNISLKFDDPAMQHTDVILNQANKESVRFNITVKEGSKEIIYTNYDKAEVAFLKRDGKSVIEPATISSSGIQYLLNDRIFDLVGTVKGQVMLSKGSSISSTLHYDFEIILDLSNIQRVSSFYVGVIERLLADTENLIQQEFVIFKDLINNIKFDSVQNYNEFTQKIIEMNTSLMSQMDIIFNDASQRTNDVIDALWEVFRLQHELMQGIVDEDFVTNEALRQHRNNLITTEQHLKKYGNSFILPDGTFTMRDAVEAVQIIINHNMDRYPAAVSVVKVVNGFGRGGAGNVPAGGRNISQFARWTSVDRNSVQLFTEEKIFNPSIKKVESNRFIVSGDDFAYHIIFA